MRVAIINTLYHPDQVGGAELTVKTIAEGLAREGVETLVISLSAAGKKSFGSHNGVATAKLPISNIYWPFPYSEQSRLKKVLWHAADLYNPISRLRVSAVLRSFSPNVIQTHNLTGFSVSAWGAMNNRRVPVLHMLHDYSLLCPKVSMMRRGKSCDGKCRMCQFARIPKRKASASVKAVVGVSEFALRTHLEADFFQRATEKAVIYNTYENTYETCGRTAQPPKPQAGHPLRVGFIGSIVPHKGIEVLLNAVSRIAGESISLQVGGIGMESYVKALQQKFPSPNITFCGKVDPKSFFRNVDLLAVPSTWNEPFGRVVIEAYAHGVPVVGSNLGGLKEIIVDGVTGRLVPPNSVRDLVEIIKQLIQEPSGLKALAQGAAEKAAEFAPSRAINKFISLHELLLREQSQAPQ